MLKEILGMFPFLPSRTASYSGAGLYNDFVLTVYCTPHTLLTGFVEMHCVIERLQWKQWNGPGENGTF